MGVIEIKGMGQVTVVERSGRGRIHLWVPDHTGGPAFKAQPGKRAVHGFIEVSGITRAKRNANVVHYQELGALDDISWYIFEIQAGNKSRQSCGF
jgi:hypothetical protein